MSLKELEPLLNPQGTLDLAAQFESFSQNKKDTTLESFISHLHSEKLIDTPTFCLALSKTQIELTDAHDFEATLVAPSGEESDIAAPLSKQQHDLIGLVGEGAMGQIHMAKDPSLLRKVAYKQLHKSVQSNKQVSRRFLNEVQITAQLDHPHIVPVYNFETTAEGNFAYSMKLVQGKTLQELIKETQELHGLGFEIDEAHSLPTLLDHFLKVCDALEYAHTKGVIHRDIKPANLMIGQYNEVYVMDWGIAKKIGQDEEEINVDTVQLLESDLSGPEAERTKIGQLMGTPRFCSPEQARGDNHLLDGRSDQVSLGLVLYEIVSLKPAYTGKTMVDLLQKVMKGAKDPLVHYEPKIKIAPELHAIIEKATAVKPEQRYATVGEMADDIRRYLRGEAILARPDNLQQKVLRWMSKHRQGTLVAVLFMALLSAGATSWSVYQQQVTLNRAQQREIKLSSFIGKVTERAQNMDQQILHFEAMLKELSTAMSTALSHGQPEVLKIYKPSQFTPPDLAYSQAHKSQISLNWPVTVYANSTDRQAIKPKLEKLMPLNRFFKRVYTESVGENKPISDTELSALIDQKGAPMIWTYYGLKEGVFTMYPGKGFDLPNYDPRVRPWYKLSAEKYGPHWGNPYIDSMGAGLLLPCSMSVYDTKNEFMGVVGVEMTFDFIIKRFLLLGDENAYQESLLLDEKGHIVLSSADSNQNYSEGELHEALDLKPFAEETVNQAIADKLATGFVEVGKGKSKTLYIFHRLNTLGWYYVVKADSQTLLGTV